MKNYEEIIKLIRQEFGWGQFNGEVAIRANFKCEYCDKNLLKNIYYYDSWQLDHVFPKSKGGEDSLENYALSCKLCNHLKNDYQPLGVSRTEKISDAAKHIKMKRVKKENELKKLKSIIFN